MKKNISMLIYLSLIVFILCSCRSREEDYNKVKSFYQNHKNEIEEIVDLFHKDSISRIMRIEHDKILYKYEINKYTNKDDTNKHQIQTIELYIHKKEEKKMYQDTIKHYKFNSYFSEYTGNKHTLFKLCSFIYKHQLLKLKYGEYGRSSIIFYLFHSNHLVYIPSNSQFDLSNEDPDKFKHIENEYYYFFRVWAGWLW